MGVSGRGDRGGKGGRECVKQEQEVTGWEGGSWKGFSSINLPF